MVTTLRILLFCAAILLAESIVPLRIKITETEIKQCVPFNDTRSDSSFQYLCIGRCGLDYLMDRNVTKNDIETVAYQIIAHWPPVPNSITNLNRLCKLLQRIFLHFITRLKLLRGYYRCLIPRSRCHRHSTQNYVR